MLALAACNQVFDLDATHVPSDHDARCPPIGQTPRFTRALTQFLPRQCDGYNFAASRGFAVAACYADFQVTIETGPLAGPLAPAPGIAALGGYGTVIAALSQDEARIYVSSVDSERTDPFAVDVYRRQPDDTWLLDLALQLRSPDANLRIGPIASDGDRDRVILTQVTTLTEYAVADQWSVVRTFPASELGVDRVFGFALTADGLRATFHGLAGMTASQYYTDRPTLDAPFRRADPLDVPYYSFAFMDDDCGRIYMAGVGSIFYAKQAR